MSDFEKSFAHLIEVEGKFTNHALDRGGPTKYGITIHTLIKWRKAAVTVEDMKNLSLDEAKAIYKALYWSPLRLDEVLDNDVATVLFDQAVNRGPGTVARQIQEHFGLHVDGVIGPKTLDAINHMHARRFIVEFFKASQLSYVAICVKDSSQLAFLKGWLKRTHLMLERLFD